MEPGNGRLGLTSSALCVRVGREKGSALGMTATRRASRFGLLSAQERRQSSASSRPLAARR
jgi:hypothetical protein